MKRIKSLLLFFALFLIGTGYQPVLAQETTTFILIRHAEKADDGTKDPVLSEAGKQRAAALAHHLKETTITTIYSTPYKRSMQTVQPLANAKGLEIKRYDPFSDSLIDEILANEAGGTVLIVGHSNTTPMLVNQLIGQKKYKQLKESDYDNIFIVSAATKGNGTAIKLIY